MMDDKAMTQRANAVYDVLVRLGGAREAERDAFVYAHTESSTAEWRFMGKLGFGGKYRNGRNAVDCYAEDETPERLALIEEINSTLAQL